MVFFKQKKGEAEMFENQNVNGQFVYIIMLLAEINEDT